MSLGKQAKILTDRQISLVLALLETRSRYPVRDRTMVLLSITAGLRAKEISELRWSMVTDAQGQVTDLLSLPNKASKGKGGGREVPLCGDLVEALRELQAFMPERGPEDRVIFSERDIGMSRQAIAVWFHRLYAELGLKGASSHSGRRTYITRLAKRVVEAGGSLRDVQQLAGHSSLSTTQRYIEGSSEAKRRVTELVWGDGKKAFVREKHS
jgi:integrase